MSKKSSFRGPLEKQHGRCAETMVKSASEHLYHSHWSLRSRFSWKKSLLWTGKILGLLLNTLAADQKYSVLNTDNLTIPIQMQLCEKENILSQFLVYFLKSGLNFQYFEKRDDPHSFCISKIMGLENVVR